VRFLITGASGFIGYPLALRLAERYGHKNTQLILPPKARNKTEKHRYEQLIEADFDIIIHDILNDRLDVSLVKPFDILFHLAAFTESETDSPLVRVNDVGTERLLSGLKSLLRGKRVVYSSSLACVDRSHPDNTPQAEDYPCNPRIIYGRTKLNAELIIQRQAKQLGFEWTILRLPTVYGPGFRPGGMFNIIAKSLHKGSLPARLSWPGRMSLIYVDDAVNILIDLGIKDVGKNTLFHASSGEDPRYDDLITLIAKTLKIKRRRISPPWPFWSIVRTLVWIPGLMSIFPFKLKIALWRISLIVIDGMVADSTKLNNALSPCYTPLEKGLAATYDKTYNFSISKTVSQKVVKEICGVDE
jgi:UDP-glucose 4-epimerase